MGQLRGQNIFRQTIGRQFFLTFKKSSVQIQTTCKNIKDLSSVVFNLRKTRQETITYVK